MFDNKTMEYILNHGMIDFQDKDKAYSDIKKFLHITDKIYDIATEPTNSDETLSASALRNNNPLKSDIKKSEFIVPKVVQE